MDALGLLLGARRSTVATVAPPHHVHGFTPKTMAMILQRAGLNVLQVTTTTPLDPLYSTARQVRDGGTLHEFAWRLAKVLGKGSMLVAWATKQ